MAKAATRTPTQVASAKQTEKTAAKAKTDTLTAVPVKYPTEHVEICKGDKALTAERAKELLGWETEAEYIAKLKTVDANLNEDNAKKIFAKDAFLTDKEKMKVALRNNTRNRPWQESVTEAYVQDLLKKHWEFNGETVIIGQYGHVLSGQHRLIALVFAEQLRTGDNEKLHWEETWDGPVTMPAVVVYGIEESPRVTRTIDNVKSRTLGDVLYADSDLFKDYNLGERKSIARAAEYAVKFLWERTGEGDKDRNSFAPKRTHSEALEFLDRHARLKDCIKFVMDEDKGKGNIARFIYPGHAAALLYMMGCSGTSQDKIDDYFGERPPREKHLKFDNLKKAKMFWSDLARGDVSVANVILAQCPVRGNNIAEDGTIEMTGKVFDTYANDKRQLGDGTQAEQVAILIRAWNQYVKDETIEPIQLTYAVYKDEMDRNVFTLEEFPVIENSIDCGKKVKVPKKKKKGEGEEATPEGDGETLDSPDVFEELTDEEGDERAEQSESAPKSGPRLEWEKNKETYAGHVLVFRSKATENYLVLFEDSTLWEEVTGFKGMLHPQTGILQTVMNPEEFARTAPQMKEAGHDILIFGRPNEKGERDITTYSPDEQPEETDGEDTPTEPVEVPAEPEPAPSTQPGKPTPNPAPPAQQKVVIKRK